MRVHSDNNYNNIAAPTSLRGVRVCIPISRIVLSNQAVHHTSFHHACTALAMSPIVTSSHMNGGSAAIASLPASSSTESLSKAERKQLRIEGKKRKLKKEES